MTLMRKRQTERPSSVDSRMTLASALSNSVSLDEPESGPTSGRLRWVVEGEVEGLVAVVLDEKLGGFESMTGFEAVEVGPHDGEQKVDDGDAVVGPVLDYGWEGHGLGFTDE